MKHKWKAMNFILLLVLLLSFHKSTVFAEGLSGSDTSDGLTVTISTDKNVYNANEVIHYTITVDNQKKNWNIDATTIKYTLSEGLNAVDEEELPVDIPMLQSGESFSLEGNLVGDPAIYVRESKTQKGLPGMLIGIVPAVACAAIAVFLIWKRKRGKGKTGAMMLLISILLWNGLFAAGSRISYAKEDEKVTLRPYVKVMYAGQEVTIRCVAEFDCYQTKARIPSEYVDNVPRICCHDPSVFEDKDGTYYIFGSFLSGGYSTDLRKWTSIDAEFQGTFTDEVKNQIREWNDDSNAGSWNSYLWAPDIIYNESMQKYCMYLSADGDDWKSNIVLLTADRVDGPYTFAGTIVYSGFTEETFALTDAPKVLGEDTIPQRYVTNGVKNKKWGDEYPNCIDPCVFFDEDGNLWMSYGSWSGGIFMLELDEETGLRDYSVQYECNEHSDAYFGTKIAGGKYVSGEASYIQKIGDYYYLFISYGGLEAKSGYNIRVFRSDRPDGDYVDALGNTPYFDEYVFNYNLSTGVRLFGGYQWRTFNYGQVAQGHNSAFVDDDKKAYLVFHTRTTDGTEGHYVKVHQLFVNKEGWLVAAPYQTNKETLNPSGLPKQKVMGDYEIILHKLDLDYADLETNKTEFITLQEDGTITGDYEGNWSLEEGTAYITLKINGVTYSGVLFNMCIENSTLETVVFTALGLQNQITLWGSKCFE